MYVFYFCSLENVPEDLIKRYMHKGSHCVYVKEYKENDGLYEIGCFNINRNGEEYLDKYEVPVKSVHHIEKV